MTQPDSATTPAASAPRRRPRALRRLRVLWRRRLGPARIRQWIRGAEVGLVLLATVSGAAAGLVAVAMGGSARLLHEMLFGPGAEHGLSMLRNIEPWVLLSVPAAGGLLLGAMYMGLARWRPRALVDPIEANALHGGRASLNDAIVVGAQNLVSNGFGASVGLEAAYAQAGAGIASRLGRGFGMRRGDLRLLVGCGTAGAIAAAFGAPITGAFYAFELVIGTYAIVALAPVMAAAVAGALVARAFGVAHMLAAPAGIAVPTPLDHGLALILGLACGLVGIGLMRGMSVAEWLVRRCMPWAPLRPAVGGLVVGVLALLGTGVLAAGHETLRFVLAIESPASALLMLLVLKTMASAMSIGSGFRGGLFFASLLLGALLGKLFGMAAVLVFGIGIDPMLYAVVGMSAFGAAVIGAPLAMAFLAFETTGDFAVAGPVLAAVAVSALCVRRLFGYSFATWRFHLRGEAIRGPHDVGWLRDLSVGRLMRRDLRSVRVSQTLDAFRRAYPLGSTQRVIVVDDADHYAGLVAVAEAHGVGPEVESLAPLLRHADQVLLPGMNAKEALALFQAAEAEALAVVDMRDHRRVIGLLSEAHVLRRYGEEIDKRRREEVGLL